MAPDAHLVRPTPFHRSASAASLTVRLMLDNIKWQGYDDQTIRRMVGAIQVEPRGEEPGIISIQDAVFVPGYESFYLEDGSRVDQSCPIYLRETPVFDRRKRDRLDAKVSGFFPQRISLPAIEDVFDEPIALIGHATPHYGHFLMEGLARMWSLQQFNDETKYIFTYRGSIDEYFRLRYVSEAFDLLGFDTRSVVEFRRPTLVRNLMVVCPSVNYAYGMYCDHRIPHEKMASRVLSRSSLKTGRSVYISRSQIARGMRITHGETEIENYLSGRGFEIVYPEKLSLSEQIELFCGATTIVGAIGSAFHSMLFEKNIRGARRIILAPEIVNGRYLCVDAVKGDCHSTTYVNAIVSDQMQGRKHAQTVDSEKALKYLKSVDL